MEIQDTTAAIYSEAKSEYTRQLVYNFQPVLLRFFLDRFTDSKQSKGGKSILAEFQESLSQIPEWNLDKVQKETSILLQSVHCDYIEDLITAVFIAHTKILSAIRLHAKPRRKIQITVPKPDHFMHRTLSECSRLLWSNVYLFSDTVPSIDRQKYMSDVNRLLEEGILQAIRNLLPVKSILRESLQEDDEGLEISSAPVDTPNDESVKAPLTETSLDLSGSLLDLSVTTPVIPKVAAPIATGPITVQTETPSVDPKGVIIEKMPESASSELPATDSIPIVKQETLVVDTERSVGFTGMDTVFGHAGEAEIRPMIEEGANEEEFEVSDLVESLNQTEFEDLNAPIETSAPLSVDEYESI
jgi:hypothetical protein